MKEDVGRTCSRTPEGRTPDAMETNTVQRQNQEYDFPSQKHKLNRTKVRCRVGDGADVHRQAHEVSKVLIFYVIAVYYKIIKQSDRRMHGRMSEGEKK